MAVTGPETGFLVVDSNVQITANTLWGIGDNTYGQLGDGTTNKSNTLNKIGALTNWLSSSGGTRHAGAIKTDGTLWAWGYNAYGVLGQGDTTSRSSPVQVGALTNWSLLSCGGYHSAAIKTDGTLWTWGNNYRGQLGLGDSAAPGNFKSTSRSSPTQVGALTNWSKVACGYNVAGATAAVKTDGTLWTWGYNYFGQLGLNDQTHRSSPVQVAALTNWKSVSVGYLFMGAIKTDGTLWTWGWNNYGQLGQGNVTHYSSPVQVGALTDWQQVVCGQSHMAAVKTDGTLWTWA